MDLGHDIEAALIFLQRHHYNYEAVRSAIQARIRSALVEGLRALPSDEERMEVLNLFCRHCGAPEPPRCHCWNDE